MSYDLLSVCLLTLLSALLSHKDSDLRPFEALIVLPYDFCDSPSITSIQTECLCGVKDLCSLCPCFHQPCDHNSLRGYINVGLVLPAVSC